MLTTSPAYEDAILAAQRQIKGKVTVVYTDPATGATGNDDADASWPLQATDGITTVPHKWASLDGTWTLDGTWHLAPGTTADADDYQMGWWGGTLAASDGTFSSGSYPTLTVTFTARPVHSLLVVGDDARDEYPTSFVVTLKAGSTTVHTETVTSNAAVTWSKELSSSVNGVTSAILEVHAWSAGSRQAKIVEFFTTITETYESTDLISIDLVEERNTDQASVPVGNIASAEITVTLRNDSRDFDPDNTASPLYQVCIANRQVTAWLGLVVGDTTEWQSLGKFWTVDWQSDAAGIEASFTARDRLQRMAATSYTSAQVQADQTLADLATTVLTDYGLTASDYAIDSSLSGTTVAYAWFGATDYCSALQQIAEAALAVVWCDRAGKIQIAPASASDTTDDITVFMQGAGFPAQSSYVPTYEIERSAVFGASSPSDVTKIANVVQIGTNPLVLGATATVYTGSAVSVPAGGSTTVTVTYDAPPVMGGSTTLTDAGADVTLSSATYYAWGAVIELANAGASAEDAGLSITGQPLTVQGQQTATATDADSRTLLGDQIYTLDDNDLIQSLSVAQAIADDLIDDWADSRRDLSLDWRGNPALELGDRVEAPTGGPASTATAIYHVVTQELSWAGALRATLTGRRVVAS